MAAAEARTAWQRTANRCFVQEDAKRAPKLACCPSSCVQQYEQGNINPTNGPDHPAPNFIPLNWYPTHSNLPPDTKWWLQLQPNFGYQKDLTCEQANCLEDEFDEPKSENTNPTLNQPEPHLGGPTKRKNDYPSESPRMISTAFMKNESIKRGEDVKTKTSNSQQTLKHKVDMDDYFYHDAELMDWKSEKTSLDMETPWAGGNKCEPWWRVVDKDELASLVAQKSQQHIENCDLPKPSQTSKDPFACLENLDTSRIFSASGGRNLHTGTCNPIDYVPHSSTSGSFDEKHWYSSELGCSPHYTEKLASATHTYATTITDLLDNQPTAKNDPSRAQLLEALRHSQTRAREAEMAAEKAYNEKEHIVKLLFRQASHLFAYKQWLHMLQLENLYHQFTSKDGQIPILFPALPWMPLKGKPSKKGKKHKKCRFCRYAFAFAVGLGLAGAGLLLGWTLGWLLPAF